MEPWPDDMDDDNNDNKESIVHLHPTPAMPIMKLHTDALLNDNNGNDTDLNYYEGMNMGPGVAVPLPPNIHISEQGNPLVQIGFWGPSYHPLMADTQNGGAPPLHEPGCCFSLAAWWTRGHNPSGNALMPSFTHCELRFANGYVCSIHEYFLVEKANGSLERVPGVVHCRVRELDRKDYYFIEFPVSKAQHDAMFRIACSYAAHKVPFNVTGLYLNFVWPFSYFPIEQKGRAFFCSELITTLLLRVGVLARGTLHPSTTSPNALWHTLSHMEQAFASFNRNTHSDAVLAALKTPSSLKYASSSSSSRPSLK